MWVTRDPFVPTPYPLNYPQYVFESLRATVDWKYLTGKRGGKDRLALGWLGLPTLGVRDQTNQRIPVSRTRLILASLAALAREKQHPKF